MQHVNDTGPMDLPPPVPPPRLAVEELIARTEDARLGEYIADTLLAGRYLYTRGLGGWMNYDGRRWRGTPEEVVGEQVRQALVESHRWVLDTYNNPQEASEALGRLSKLLSAQKLRSLLWIVRLRLTRPVAEFDAHPDLLNARNGVVDLRSGELGPHDPDLLLTKVTMTDYVSGATHADWDKALEAVPDDAVKWLQERLGQGLTAFVTTNYTPRVDETDHGTWRRLALLPFPYTYRDAVGGEFEDSGFDRKKDSSLRERMRLGGDGRFEAVLAWLVEGAVRWYAGGRVMSELPDTVVRATHEWRSSVDLIGAYIEQYLEFGSRIHVISAELYEDFADWLKGNGHVVWSDQTWTERFKQHELVRDHNVTKQRNIRHGREGLSRRPTGGAQTLRHMCSATYTAWFGVGFKKRGQSDPKAAGEE